METAREGIAPRIGADPTETFDEVFDREHEPMLRVAFLLLGSRALAEEAVQDSFARLLDRYDTVTNPGGYVRTATINRCRDLLRRRKREERFLNRLGLGRAAGGDDHGPQTEAPAVGEFDDVLATLDPRRREIVVLRYFLDLSNREIAAHLDMHETTVRTTLHRALADLREQLS